MRSRFTLSVLSAPGLLLAASIGALPACGGAQDDAYVAPPSPMLGRALQEDGTILETFDVNLDGNADIWSYLQPVDVDDQIVTDRNVLELGTWTDLRLIRKELDVNFDGRVDTVREYGARGRLVRELLDRDFDGRLDHINHFDGTRIGRRTQDANGDGNDNEVRVYRAGQLFRIERDTTGNGDVDEWSYYVDGELDRIGRDLNADGIIDEWDRRTQPMTAPTPQPPRSSAPPDAPTTPAE